MDDSYEQTVFGLLRKRAQVACDIEAHRNQMTQALVDLDHLDASIRILKPDIDLDDMPIKVLPPPSGAFRGEVQRFLLDVLRTADRRLPTSELAQAIMRVRKLDPRDRILAKLIERRTSNALRRLKRQGWVDSCRYSAGAEHECWKTDKPGEAGGWRNGSGVID